MLKQLVIFRVLQMHNGDDLRKIGEMARNRTYSVSVSHPYDSFDTSFHLPRYPIVFAICT